MYLTSTSSKIVEILEATITNESNETNEQLAACLQKVTSLGTPTATAVTPAPHEPGDQAATVTVKANVTASEPAYGANGQGADIVNAYGLQGNPSVGGWYFQPLPETRIYVAPSGSIGIRLLNAPTAFDAVVTLCFREIG